MAFISSIKKASLTGAFFIAFSLATASTSVRADCSIDTSKLTTATVRYVHDGDTLTLSDNRRVRLIGINAPEMQQGRNNQPLAIEARNHLRKLLFMEGNKIHLKTGRDAKDRHDRLLAHIYLKDGSSVAEHLIHEGFGWVVAVGENTSAATCLKIAEQLARQARKGIWSNDAYTAISAKKLKLRTRGFKLVEGKISRYNESLKASWLHLNSKLAIRIPKSALQHFSVRPSSQWIGQTIEVRGWLYASKGQLMMNVYHPAALQHINETPNEGASLYNYNAPQLNAIGQDNYVR